RAGHDRDARGLLRRRRDQVQARTDRRHRRRCALPARALGEGLAARDPGGGACRRAAADGGGEPADVRGGRGRGPRRRGLRRDHPVSSRSRVVARPRECWNRVSRRATVERMANGRLPRMSYYAKITLTVIATSALVAAAVLV